MHFCCTNTMEVNKSSKYFVTLIIIYFILFIFSWNIFLLLLFIVLLKECLKVVGIIEHLFYSFFIIELLQEFLVLNLFINNVMLIGEGVKDLVLTCISGYLKI